MAKMVDQDQDLGEMEGDEEFVFPPAERKVVTQPIDLSVQTLNEQWNNRVLILPEIQREYVWDNAKASRASKYGCSAIRNPPPMAKVANGTQPSDCSVAGVFSGHR